MPIIKLKITLKSNVTFIIVLITCIYTFVCVKNNIYISNYNELSTGTIGIIKNIEYDGSLVKIYIDDVLVRYYLNTDEKLKYDIGDKVKVNGKFEIPNEEENFYLFNYKNYLYSKNIHYIVESNSIELVNKNKYLIFNIKKAIIKRIQRSSSNKYLNLFILGNNDSISEEINTSYQLNGISHLFSISGMHISIFTAVLLFFLKKLIRNSFFVNLIVCLFLIFYMFITNFTVSVIRASFMFILCIFKDKYKLGLSNTDILLYLFSISLILNPYNIYNNGFLFSYFISFHLLKYGKRISEYKNYFVKLFITSLISFIVSIPILINSYFSINLLTPFVNMIFVPIVSLIIFPLSLLTFFVEPLSPILNILISYMENLSLIISKYNFFTISLCHISNISIILYYIIINFIVNKITLKEYKYIIVLVIIIVIHHNIRVFDKYPIISFINVGQGDCILLTLPHARGNILIDCADVTKYNTEVSKSIGKRVIIPYLKAQGVNRLHSIIITHGDYDHIGSLSDVIDNIKTDQVIFNSGNDNSLEKECILNLQNKKITYRKISRGKIKIDKYSIFFLNKINHTNENEDSLVIYFEINNNKVLLMGDAGFDTENYILDEYNIRNLDILKVGHHGSKYSSSKRFLDRMNPTYSIISVGENNKYNHPSSEVIDMLSFSTTYLTSINGSIEFKLRKKILVNSVR